LCLKGFLKEIIDWALKIYVKGHFQVEEMQFSHQQMGTQGEMDPL